MHRRFFPGRAHFTNILNIGGISSSRMFSLSPFVRNYGFPSSDAPNARCRAYASLPGVSGPIIGDMVIIIITVISNCGKTPYD